MIPERATRILTSVGILVIVAIVLVIVPVFSPWNIMNQIRSRFLYPADTVEQPHTEQPRIFSTPYGEIRVHEPIILALIDHNAMQRLHGLRQYGVCHYTDELALRDYTRYQHSVGVFALLRLYGCSLNEQIAGLLHDASHTVFSHLGDFFAQHPDRKNSYQDDIHEWFLNSIGVTSTLQTFGISAADILHKNDGFRALEQDLPDLCADRIEYNLQGGMIYGLLSQADIDFVLKHLIYTDTHWIFTNIDAARTLALVPLYLSEHLWGSPLNHVINTLGAAALRFMVHDGTLTLDDVHFGIDDHIWQQIQRHPNPHVSRVATLIVQGSSGFSLVHADQQYDVHVISKCRGVNPLIKTDTGLFRLTELDPAFKEIYESTISRMKQGWFIRYHDEVRTTLAALAVPSQIETALQMHTSSSTPIAHRKA